MDVSVLTTFLAPFLPYLLKAGEKGSEEAGKKLGEKFGGDAWEKAKSLWAKLSPNVKAKAAAIEAASDVANDPEDKDALAALRLQLKKLLNEDSTLAHEITHLFEEAKQTGSVSNVIASGKHLLALINDILDLSKIESNQLEIQWETVDVPLLCKNVLALLKEKAAKKGLELCLTIESDITTLVADPLRLKQMLLNLLFNALKFTSKGSIGLQVFPKGEFVHFTVWDTGTGISQEDQAQLFQPYFQLAKAVAGGVEGTGLGLAVTSKLAEIHGGSVKVESEVDCGSRFTLVLPLLRH